MRTWAIRFGASLLLLAMAIVVGLMVWEPLLASPGKAPPPRAYSAEIVRDEWGVPHIYGKTDADVAYGVAQAHAEDDFRTLQDVVAMTRGRYGAIAGQDGAQFDYVLALLDARGTVDRQYARLEPRTRALLDAYATGLNDYAAAHPGEVRLGSLFPVNGEDIATGFALRQPFFFGLNNVVGPLVTGETLLPDPGPRLRGTPLPDREGAANLGSNAFAIAPGRSDDGVTRLVSNSHQPWEGGVAWYELVVESGKAGTSPARRSPAARSRFWAITRTWAGPTRSTNPTWSMSTSWCWIRAAPAIGSTASGCRLRRPTCACRCVSARWCCRSAARSIAASTAR